MQLVVKYIEWVCELVLQHMQLTFLFFILIYEEYVFFYNTNDKIWLSCFENIR